MSMLIIFAVFTSIAAAGELDRLRVGLPNTIIWLIRSLERSEQFNNLALRSSWNDDGLLLRGLVVFRS